MSDRMKKRKQKETAGRSSREATEREHTQRHQEPRSGGKEKEETRRDRKTGYEHINIRRRWTSVASWLTQDEETTGVKKCFFFFFCVKSKLLGQCL